MSFWKRYFQFTRKERNGILFLLIILVVVWTFYFAMDYYFEKKEVDFSSFEQEVNHFYRQLDSINEQKQQSVSAQIAYNKDTCKVEINSPDLNTLLCIGLSEKLAKTWINYLNKGGKFKSVEEVKKLWGMNDSIYNNLLPYLFCEGQEQQFDLKKRSQEKELRKIEMVELNTADSLQLMSLPSIGSSFAKRIIKYRERLGGFVTKEQLKEIYGFSEEMFEKVSPYVYVDVFEVKKLHLNKADYLTLIQHPYLSKNMVKGILQLRKNVGNITSKEELIMHNVISLEDWEKIKWYVEF